MEKNKGSRILNMQMTKWAYTISSAILKLAQGKKPHKKILNKIYQIL